MLYIELECKFFGKIWSLSASKGCIFVRVPPTGFPTSISMGLWGFKPKCQQTPWCQHPRTCQLQHALFCTYDPDYLPHLTGARELLRQLSDCSPNLGSGPLNQAANASWSRQHPVGPKHTFLWPRQVLCMRCNHHRHNPTVQRAGSLNGILFLANAVTSVAGPPDAWIQDYEGAKQSASEILTLIQVKRQR